MRTIFAENQPAFHKGMSTGMWVNPDIWTCQMCLTQSCTKGAWEQSGNRKEGPLLVEEQESDSGCNWEMFTMERTASRVGLRTADTASNGLYCYLELKQQIRNAENV